MKKIILVLCFLGLLGFSEFSYAQSTGIDPDDKTKKNKITYEVSAFNILAQFSEGFDINNLFGAIYYKHKFDIGLGVECIL